LTRSALSPVSLLRLLAASALLVADVRAEWQSSPSAGLEVCGAVSHQYVIRGGAVSEGSGGVIVAWSDSRSGDLSPDIYAQRVLANGSLDPGWPTGGAAICTASSSQTTPVLVADGSGGAIVVWRDFRTSVTNGLDIYAHHIRADGTLDPNWPANGLPVCTQPGEQTWNLACSDGAGGAIVVWQDSRTGGTPAIYAHHVLSSGIADPIWPADGRALASPVTQRFNPSMLSDGNGGAFVFWSDKRDGAGDIFGMHVQADGSLDPAWPVNGLAICTADDYQNMSQTVSDGQGGALVSWSDLRAVSPSSPSGSGAYVQHVLATGIIDPVWPVNGRALASSPKFAADPVLAADGQGGAWVAWEDWRASPRCDVYAQHVLANGDVDPAWHPEGVAVSVAAADQGQPTIMADGGTGVFIAWHDERNGSKDIYAARLLWSGAPDPRWDVNGNQVSTAAASQEYPMLVPDGHGAAIAVWPDGRMGTFDVYAQRIQPDGVLGGALVSVGPAASSGLWLSLAQANPVRSATIELRAGAPSGEPARVELVDVSGRLLARQEVVGANGAGARIVLSPGRKLASGVYLIRLVQGHAACVRRVVLLD